jgi:hypothetical protein
MFLSLSHPAGSCFAGFSAVAAASGLTLLSLASSATSAWSGSTAPLAATDLGCITALQLLQVRLQSET